MSFVRFLFEQKTTARYSVFQRNRADGKRPVIVYDFVLAGIERVYQNREGQVGTEVVEPWRQQTFQVGLRIDMQIACPLHHTERGYQSDQSEAVVAMEVGNKDVIQACYPYSVLAKRELYPLATIDEKLFLAQFKQLPTWCM